jgi:hypothetical protein
LTLENVVLSEIYEPNNEEETGECRKLHSDELHDLYSSQNIIDQIKEGETDRALAGMGETRNTYRLLV